MTNPASEGVEQKARELLADEEESDGFTAYAAWLRDGCPDNDPPYSERDRKDLEATTGFRALVAALSNTDGERIRREALEEAAKVAESFPRQILMFWDRPGGPPGNGYRPSNFADIAESIRSLISTPQEEA